MIRIRPANERGPTRISWLDSRHSFSFGHYYDPQHMGFGPLRVINEDVVAPGAGFETHGHANMEILTWVLDGALAHRDSLGSGGEIRPGDLQRMSAGSGIQHSEFNASKTEPVHFLQIWIQPDALNGPAEYAQTHFPAEARRGRFALLASKDGADGSISLRQDARVLGALLQPGDALEYSPQAGRRLWLQVASGAVEVNGQSLGHGDGAAIESEPALRFTASAAGELLLFDLPPATA